MDKIRWGILSTGKIAEQFASDFSRVKNGILLGVGSRTLASAEQFADKFNIPKRYGSYAELVSDPDVDAVYVATPHPFHLECSTLALEAGKAVLCEKPFTMNRKEAEVLISLAQSKGLFLMEAMWARFNPATVRLREFLADSLIGDIVSVRADLGFKNAFDPENRLFKRELGGGALLDLGVYPVSLAVMILGKPSLVTGTAAIGTTGVDEQNAFCLGYPDGRFALLSSGLRATTENNAYVFGTKGTIRINPLWINSEGISVIFYDRESNSQDINCKFERTASGLNNQAEHMNNCLLEGKMESPVMPMDQTLTVMEIMDELRKQWGVVYPGEV